MNFIFISPNFPQIYYNFVVALKKRGITVLGIGDAEYYKISQELKDNLEEYCATDLNNYEYVKNTVSYLQNKYGHIDYIESNNEYWLELDSKLRYDFNVQNGLMPYELEKLKSKECMKEFYKKALVKTARYIRPSKENVIKFVRLVGYPVFVKPVVGVGGQESYKISNNKELRTFLEREDISRFIMEEYVNGDLISFDGIADSNSNIVVYCKEYFYNQGSDLVVFDLDEMYYQDPFVDNKLLDIGKRVVKAFEVKKRVFHSEYFVLKEDKRGLGKKGDIIPIEVNLRSPGGNTMDLLNAALGVSTYEIYADIICYDENRQEKGILKYACASSRKDRYNYKHSHEEVLDKYKDSIFSYGRYSKALAPELGDSYYFITGDTLEAIYEFDSYVRDKI
ncbi:MAG: ATP-grasp domain-containing protein [Acholeplasmatales bacterium]|jgi:hypothetical protein|nr:ATP-grasp domain-containing protein [Acholeplasmatales bacterium]